MRVKADLPDANPIRGAELSMSGKTRHATLSGKTLFLPATGSKADPQADRSHEAALAFILTIRAAIRRPDMCSISRMDICLHLTGRLSDEQHADAS